MDLLKEAYDIAEKAHEGQKRKFGGEDKGKPYIVHPTRVAESVKCIGEDYEMAAILHDVVEDTTITLEDLKAAGMPEQVVEAVDRLSHREDEEYLDYVLRAADYEISRVVKMADIRDNLRDIHKGSMRDKYFCALYILAAWHGKDGGADAW